jgi:hypothetical protein
MAPISASIKEIFFEAIVLGSYFFLEPAKYIETYRLSWPEIDPFLISFSVFLLFFIYLLKLKIEWHIIDNIAFIVRIKNVWSKITEFISYHVDNRVSKNHVTRFLNIGFVIFGTMTLVQAIIIYNKFKRLNNPYFFDFISNYFLYLFIIFIIIAALSIAVEKIDKLMSKGNA